MATKSECREIFNERVHNLINSHLLLADKAISLLLKCVASIPEFTAILGQTLARVSYVEEFERSRVIYFKDGKEITYEILYSKDKKIVDLGCGNGYIPIFLTLRTKEKIQGVELQPDIYDLAVRSVEINNLQDQITIINGNIKDIYKTLGVSCYDTVTCNPPYFVYKETSNLNKNDYLTIARHEVEITLDEVVRTASILLKEGGNFAMVHRTERLMDVLEAFRKYSIEPKRLRFVYPRTDDLESLIILIEGKKFSGNAFAASKYLLISHAVNRSRRELIQPDYIINRGIKRYRVDHK